MVGKIPIKVFGPVKHGDHIYASNELPGVGVTEKQLCADKSKLCIHTDQTIMKISSTSDMFFSRLRLQA